MNYEKVVRPTSGAMMLTLTLALFVISGYGIYYGIRVVHETNVAQPGALYIILSSLIITIASIMCGGFFVVEPNGSKVLLLFGRYVGSVKESGFYWVNPFMTKRPVSLRAINLDVQKLKVNDLVGNPVEVGCVVLWQVQDTYRAAFEVQDYGQFVALQSETALRHLTSSYSYDADDDTLSLRRNTSEVAQHLKEEIQESFNLAGLKVLEARITYLAYAPEIAGAMLRRQQAAAVIAARQRIVDGAVGMVEMALQRLTETGTVHLDEERKAAMVTNLMVVLCSEQAAQPVLNAGTLHH
ncbi:MAG: SPFH domain-containing protein [Armatimonadetes bacterium]|nr:SPFH domain-containing protein [Armatimonadota bacterium]